MPTQIKKFFTDRRRRLLNISAIEKEAKLPAKTLDHFLKGRRQLSDEATKQLLPIIENLGFKQKSLPNEKNTVFNPVPDRGKRSGAAKI